ncbi:hypothetical protein EG68_01372 [Paragonimus skrjabini miyazakii]|uniref:X-ray radiation resistance-associated protein 1 n=1 Tax=Paragonimus skrjabini miyazakii TaxID=59628 RepID=A0A8S9Z7D2_9TREM|nr:hypothetical protein EG68_01372 [Paragonimus skrjabini miyazakii]
MPVCYSIDCFPPRPIIEPKNGKWIQYMANEDKPRRSYYKLQCNTNAVKLRHPREELKLNKNFVMNHFKLSFPEALYELNISGLNLDEDAEADLREFIHLRKVDASENMLSLSCFYNLPRICELDLCLNQICSITAVEDHLVHLQHLDLSYNFLNNPAAISQLGFLPNLVKLFLTGNGLIRLPLDMAEPEVNNNGIVKQRFIKLEVLHLDDNNLSKVEDIASLATLPRLRSLNISRNQFRTIPLLKAVSLMTDFEDSKPNITDSIPSASVNKNTEIAVIHTSNLEPCTKGSSPSAYEKPIPVEGKKLGGKTTDTECVNGIQTSADCSDLSLAPTQRNGSKTQLSHSLAMPVKSEPIRDDILWEQRNPMAPRVRIVDEFLGQNDVHRVFHLRNRFRGISYRGAKPSLSKTTENLRKSNMRMYPTNANRRPFPATHLKHDRPAQRKSSAGSNSDPCKSSSTTSLTNLYSACKSPFLIPPFPALQYLDLSHNQICYEEHLLPVAVWPQLKEVVVHNNPVITRHSGMPRLLDRLLVRRLAINLRRSPDATSWFDVDSNHLIPSSEDNNRTNGTSLKKGSRPQLALPSPLRKSLGKMSCKQVLNATQSRSKLQGKYQKSIARAPLVVPTRLTTKQLDTGPKFMRCDPDKLLLELRAETETSSLVSSNLSVNKLLSPANRSSIEHSTETVNSLCDLPESPQAVKPLPPISGFQPSFSSDIAQPDGDTETEGSDSRNFFTTQLADLVVDRSSSLEIHSVSKQSEEELETDLDNEQSSCLGPLLPKLPWIVDEGQLPESMQACLRELRFWCQHRPTLHPVVPLSLRSGEEQTLALMQPMSDDLAVVNDMSLVHHEEQVRKTLTTKLQPLQSDMKQIHLSKVLATSSIAKTNRLTKDQHATKTLGLSSECPVMETVNKETKVEARKLFRQA